MNNQIKTNENNVNLEWVKNNAKLVNLVMKIVETIKTFPKAASHSIHR